MLLNLSVDVKPILFHKLYILLQLMNLLIHFLFEMFIRFHHQLEILIFYNFLSISKT